MTILRRVYRWLDLRLGISSSILPIIVHPVPKRTNGWYVFGSATLVAFIVQVVTGVVLAFVYVPAPNSAYDTLQFITHQAALGSVLRGIHYWGASAMVVLIVIHTVRVFLMGSFKFPREMNWLTGAVLLLLTLGMAFTGQLLRWNQDAYWAVVVAASQAGRFPLIGGTLAHLVVAGQTVGGQTLTRFYATHVFLLPALMFLLIGAHLYMVVRHGISDPPVPGQVVDPATEQERYHEVIEKEGIPFWPDAAWRDIVFALAVGSVVLLLAIVLGPAELGQQADPTRLQVYPRPDWYFLWYFALLALMPPGIEDYVIIGAPLVGGLVLLLLPFVAPSGERSPRRRPWAVGTVGVALVAIAVLVWYGHRAPWSPQLPVPELPAAAQGLSPNLQRGADIFQSEACIACHQMDGVGGSRGPDLTHAGSRLTREQLTWRILYGGTNMPAYSDTMKPDQVNALVDFLLSRT
jgi:ubiquinol-cytochrome c reductase cytochrome b subunit